MTAYRAFPRVTLRTVTGNTASQKVAAAAGFGFEGVLRNAARRLLGSG